MPENNRLVRLTAEDMENQRLFMERFRALNDRLKTYCVVTYGCQMNAHDSEHIAGMLGEMGLKEAADRTEADFVIFNTCCVRDNAERRALGNVTWLKEIKKNKPQMMIAVCGCMVQEPGMAEKILKQYRFVDLAFGTSNLYRLPELMLQALESESTVVSVDELDTVAEELPVARLRQDAAYINIMYGCNNFCSYCIVPYVRGRERSRRSEDILREAAVLRDNGVKEIMLLGQNVNSYGQGLEEDIDFATLLRKVDALGIERVRFMTSHPKDLSDALIDAMGSCSHVLPQFHLPVQSGNDEILKRMNRHYTRDQYLDRLRRLREAVPGIGITTDIIVAFPGETEAQFMDTMSLVDEVGYDSAFTFVYSPRTGTKAASFPDQIPEEVAKDRIQRLIQLQEKRQREKMQRFVGQEEMVLVENLSRRSDLEVSGKGGHGISVTFTGSEADIGKIIPVRINSCKQNTLMGERLD